ncbi:mett11d1 fc73c11 wu:fc73c11 isoform 2 [Scophthalmus maximus]|uniref:Ribosome assembly protein METTL17, mitochondrial n=1 Tax=Scophthalmus maximus TaxID=52904 RepID=A0A2U9BIM3_SCOMX|nr:methyltransferase-like protein 17, mitochondrial [Scophthalmus maximus]AWP03688.1 mett11d1 fc73c11 wu:fc73c11 [Scophthalmus maximus]AWP03689.1 mett11d1 fc73c11 wu:fc73c11 isoform 2 [Scophthalmus maximus]
MASRSYSVRVLCQRAGVARMTFRGMIAAAQPQAEVDFLKGEPHRKHPGVTNLKALRLPEELQTAARTIIQSAQVAQLTDRSHSLTNFLWSRKRAVEDATLRKAAVSLERELWKKAIEKGGDIDEEALEDRIKKKVLSELRRTTYRWTHMKYDEEFGVVYMAARLAGGYAAMRRALNEIKKRDPSFAPQSLLDFGSGLGTVVWASHSYWADSLKEMVCVDSSGPMNTLAERLLKGADEKAQPHIKQVYFRQFLPVSPKVQFDLVAAAFTLSEISGVKDREEAVFTLWRKTGSYLVLVENGTKEGHQLLMEARDTLLMKQETTVHDSRPASVFAPCPHELTCPKLAQKMVVPCNFQQLYHPLPLPGHNECRTEKFSYLIVTRGEPAEPAPDGTVDWARLVAPVLRRARHVHCRTCSSDGQLHHMVVTARKHSRDVYRCARSSEWGDRLPIVPTAEEDEHSDSEG